MMKDIISTSRRVRLSLGKQHFILRDGEESMVKLRQTYGVFTGNNEDGIYVWGSEEAMENAILALNEKANSELSDIALNGCGFYVLGKWNRTIKEIQVRTGFWDWHVVDDKLTIQGNYS